MSQLHERPIIPEIPEEQMSPAAGVLSLVPQAQELSYSERLQDQGAMLEHRLSQPSPVQEEPSAEEKGPQHLDPSPRTSEDIDQDLKGIKYLLGKVSKGKIPEEIGVRDWKTETSAQYDERIATEVAALKELRVQLRQEQKAIAEQEAKAAAEAAEISARQEEAAAYKLVVAEHNAQLDGRNAYISRLTKSGVSQTEANAKADDQFPVTSALSVNIDGSVAAQKREAKDADTKTYAEQLKAARREQLLGATEAAEIREAAAISQADAHQERMAKIIAGRQARQAKPEESAKPITPPTTGETSQPKDPTQLRTDLKQAIKEFYGANDEDKSGAAFHVNRSVAEIVDYFGLDEQEAKLLRVVHASVDERRKRNAQSTVDDHYLPQLAAAYNAVRKGKDADRANNIKAFEVLLEKYALVGDKDSISKDELWQKMAAANVAQATPKPTTVAPPKPKQPQPPTTPPAQPTSTPTPRRPLAGDTRPTQPQPPVTPPTPARRRTLADRRPTVAKTASFVRKAIGKIPSRSEYKENTAFVFDSLTKSTRELLNNPEQIPAKLRKYKEDRKFVLDSLTKNDRPFFTDPEHGKKRKQLRNVGALAVGAFLLIGTAVNGSHHDAPKPSSNVKTSPLKPASPAPSEAPITVKRIVSSVPAPEAAPKTTEKLTYYGDTVSDHVAAHLKRNHEPVNSASIAALSNRVIQENGIPDPTKMPIGAEFNIPQ